MQIMKSTEIIIYTRNYLLYNDFISLSWYLFILLLVYALTFIENCYHGEGEEKGAIYRERD